mgnify:CR=1 FL=1
MLERVSKTLRPAVPRARGVRTMLAVALLTVASFAAAVELRGDHPDTYVVKRGDTLWDIAGRFLQRPWLWPEIWQASLDTLNMLLGSMLSHLFGMGSGMFADIMGLLMNGLLIVVAIMAVRWLWNKFRGNKTSASRPSDYRQDLEMRQQPMDSQQQMRTPIHDIKPRGNDYEPKSTADRYRNR